MEGTLLLWRKTLDAIGAAFGDVTNADASNNSGNMSREWFTTLHEDLTALSEQYRSHTVLHGHLAKLHGLVLNRL